MPRTADKTDIPRRLLEAGQALFHQLGYNATGIQQIADKAGVPKGSFYNHFDSKEAFAAEIIRRYGVWVDDAWQAAMRDAPPEPMAAIAHLFGGFIAHHERTGLQGCLLGNFAAEVADSSTVCRSAMCGVLSGWRDGLATLIAQAQARGQVRTDLDAQTLSGFFWDAWEGAVLRMKLEHSTQPLKDVVALMLDRFLVIHP